MSVSDAVVQVASYERVSDDKKKSDGERRQDVQRQHELIKNYLERKGITEFNAYVDDGKSAWTEDINMRPAFRQLLNDCRRYHIREIYIEDMTRFSRNVLLGLQLLKELGELGVQVISLREGEIEVTSSRGWMQSLMLLMFAEWDSRVKSEKVRSGMERALEKICPSCKVHHAGRHPKSCRCPKCLGEGKNFPDSPQVIAQQQGTSQG